MAITDIFSKRQKRREKTTPDVFVYDIIPESLRVQIGHMITESHRIFRDSVFEGIHNDLSREYGVWTLGDLKEHFEYDLRGVQFVNYLAVVRDFVTYTKHPDRVLDVIELILLAALKYDKEPPRRVKKWAPLMIAELNERFLEHGVGYQYECGEIVRIDSKYIHKEVVVPALLILESKIFKGSNDEFLSAHEHYRHGRHAECLVDCLKAFESTMKAICKKRGWDFESTATANKLISICHSKGLFPSFMEMHSTGLTNSLESGVPTLPNKVPSHGQGTEIREVHQHYASYCLHLTASNILFLAKCDEALK